MRPIEFAALCDAATDEGGEVQAMAFDIHRDRPATYCGIVLLHREVRPGDQPWRIYEATVYNRNYDWANLGTCHVDLDPTGLPDFGSLAMARTAFTVLAQNIV